MPWYDCFADPDDDEDDDYVMDKPTKHKSRSRWSLHRLWTPDGTYTPLDQRPSQSRRSSEGRHDRPPTSTSSPTAIPSLRFLSPSRHDGFHSSERVPSFSLSPSMTPVHPPLPYTPEVQSPALSPASLAPNNHPYSQRRHASALSLASPAPSTPFSPNSVSWADMPSSPTNDPPPYTLEIPQSRPQHQPWHSAINLSSPPSRSARQNRHRAIMSADDLTRTLSGQLHAAAQSVGNLNALVAGSENSGFYERISARLNEVLSEIDNEIFTSGEYVLDPDNLHHGLQRTVGPVLATRDLVRAAGGASTSQSANSSFSKVWLYANSRLPPYLPPLKVYMPTYPLLCLAAQYSLRVYDKPQGREREDHINASIFHRTKAMTLKSLPVDDMNTIVFAIRGSSSFIDWAVNFRPAPSSPEGFLDDPGNMCHAGFLSIAKGMVRSVAARLRTLLAENPHRTTSSLLITGHSAGGAVAQLLYTHMLSRTVESELTYLTGFFKRVHCVTFGTPPVSLLPLETPKSKQNRKSLFFSFVNEGDPVARADKAIVRSLLKLYTSPAPLSPSSLATSSTTRLDTHHQSRGSGRRHSEDASRGVFKWTKPSTWSPDAYAPSQPIWPIPNATLSLGGRIVLMRPRPVPLRGGGGGGGGSRAHGSAAAEEDDVEAVTVNDEMLREVVFGDPACHTMTMYSKRIETLATRAVTVGGF